MRTDDFQNRILSPEDDLKPELKEETLNGFPELTAKGHHDPLIFRLEAMRQGWDLTEEPRQTAARVLPSKTGERALMETTPGAPGSFLLTAATAAPTGAQ